jgi:hypothetical protein
MLPMPKSGVAQAVTGEGHESPVIDMTHPGFALADDAQARATLHEARINHG